MSDDPPLIPGLFAGSAPAPKPKPGPPAGPRVFTVGEITTGVRRLLEDRFARVTVRGEISGFKPHASGHLYFRLKDGQSQLQVVMFRSEAMKLRFVPADGLEVEVTGTVTYYEPQGRLQLQARRMEPAGVGALMQALSALREKLDAEGLFAAERKRELPRYPGTIALITSPSGAAVRDMVHVLRRRWPAIQLVLLPVRVQGEGAALEIADALRRVGRWGDADLVIVGRGGGSLEDLWAFNEEPVVRAIAACPLPVISAVGHETDTTLADLAADRRAATPSAAAELAVPDHTDLVVQVRRAAARLGRHAGTAVRSRRTAVERLMNAYGFRRPEEFLQRQQLRVDDLSEALGRAFRTGMETRSTRIDRLASELRRHHPAASVERSTLRVRDAQQRLHLAANSRTRTGRTAVTGLDRALRALDPTAVLGRGYCLVREGADGPVVRSAQGMAPGTTWVLQFQEDRARARIESTERGGPTELHAASEDLS